MKIAELKENVGLNGIDIEGEITKIYPQKSGEGKFGKWTMQTIIIGDDTGSIPVIIWNHPEIKGQGVFKAISVPDKNDQNIKKGIEVFKSVWTDTEGVKQCTVKVKVDKKARIISPAFVIEGKAMEEEIPVQRLVSVSGNVKSPIQKVEVSEDVKVGILKAVCKMFRITDFPVPGVLKENIVEIARYIEQEYFGGKQVINQSSIIQKVKEREPENPDDEEIPF